MLQRWCELIDGIGDDARQQRLDGGQDGDGDAVGEFVAENPQVKLGNVKRGKAGVDGVQVADGADVQVEGANHGRADDDGHKRAGDAAGHARPHDEDGKAHGADQQRLPVDGGDVGADGGKLVGGFDDGGTGGVCETKQVFDLANHDGDGDAGHEARRDGVRHKADERAKLQQAHEHQQNAGDDGRRDKAVDAVGGNNSGDDGGERGGGTRDLHAAAAKQRNEEAGDDSGVKPLLRADT